MASGAPRWKSCKSALLTLALVTLIMGVPLAFIAGYSGHWPPLATVSSGSMQHDHNASQLRSVDVGDIVIIKTATTSEIVTYLEGFVTGYSKYGDYGDVVIFSRPELSQPVIHRALCQVEYNSTSASLDIPSLANFSSDLWETDGDIDTWWNISGTLTLRQIGPFNATIMLSVPYIISTMGQEPHGGLITVGDSNTISTDNGTFLVTDQNAMAIIGEPITDREIIGKASGELPWIGLIRLVLSGQLPENVPPNTIVGCIVLFPLLISLPSVVVYAGESVVRNYRKNERNERP